MTGMRIGILVFEGVEEMDFAGPWEVLTSAAEGTEGHAVFTVAETTAPVRCEKGLIVIPDRTYDTVHDLDVLLIPGGSGARREGQNPATVAWIRAVAPGCAWIASVCTGAFLLLAAGPGRNRRITTHHRFVDRLRALGGAEVVDGVRFVRDGNVVSSAGVMAGIDMSLWLAGQLFGTEAADAARDYIAYDIPPRERVSLDN